MNYLKSFVPWIGFAIVSTQADWRWSGVVGVLLAGGLLLVERGRGKAWDTLIIELSAVVFFALLSIYAFTDPASPLHDYVGASSDAWLALTAWGSVAIRRPFTLGIARTMAPPEVWDHPFFRRVNVIITSVWAASFTVSAVAGGLLLHFAPHATVALIVIKVLGFAVPVAFTVGYSRQARARAQRAASAE
ncbi:hypothetical protein VSH64_23525 [Amycolatopsis rhabdoformis]|uniref:DUF3159 domain-containing protein n=1 Tax=Amycolatopsis rhabdoformis TaxID=1448059 RepID=A0ABZ1INS6_9PSEU|nr:hypothetical protein [Amycolatopsis rhabdoformis]WSE35005.1 hypothetical protein VSH64_23525 [Amycolatopsis rhabdoformis]